jgi:FAD binding domain
MVQLNQPTATFTLRNALGIVMVAIVTPFCIRAAFTASNGNDAHYISYPKNAGVGGPCETIFHPTNNVKIKSKYATQDQEFASGLQALKDIVNKASSDGMRLRPIGTRWNMNNLPYSDEYMVETRELTYVKIGIDEPTSHLTTNYQNIADTLTFVQSGVTIRNLYSALFEKGLTLPTSAVTDGMTIGGGVSTGTHNAGLDFGGMQDFVRGIHLVLNDRTVFVQPSTNPVVTEAYALTVLDADVLTNDDALFYNALVSYGAYGIIHGLLIEPVELCK